MKKLFTCLLLLALVTLASSPAWAAVSCSALASGSGTSTTDASSYATSSVTLTAGRLYLLGITSRVTTGPGNTPTATSTGATWAGVASQGFDNDDSTGRFRVAVLRTMVASNQTGAVTIDFGGHTQLAASHIIVECTGTDTSGSSGSGAIVQNPVQVGVGVTNITVTFSAYGNSANRPVAFFGAITGNAAIMPTDWTDLGEQTNADTVFLSANWLAFTADTTVNSTTTGSTTDHGGIGVEVKAAAVACRSGMLRMGAARLGVGA